MTETFLVIRGWSLIGLLVMWVDWGFDHCSFRKRAHPRSPCKYSRSVALGVGGGRGISYDPVSRRNVRAGAQFGRDSREVFCRRLRQYPQGTGLFMPLRRRWFI